MTYNNLSIITISFKDPKGVKETTDSIKDYLDLGATHIIITKGIKANYSSNNTIQIKDEDTGLYNALNLALRQVKTTYFFILHSGDKLLSKSIFNNAYNLLIDGDYDLIIGGSKAGKRIQSARLWHPYMFNLLIQPPHLSIIYKSQFVKSLEYIEDLKCISDFYYLKMVFKLDPRYLKINGLFVDMQKGGITTGSFDGKILILREFIRIEGFYKTIFIYPLRIIIKLIFRL